MAGSGNIDNIKDHQFEKGVSGNPTGRPKGATGLKQMRTLLREMVCIEVAGDSVLAVKSGLIASYPTLFINPDGSERRATLEQMVNAKLLNIALTGKEHNSIAACNSILNRLYGAVEREDDTAEDVGGTKMEFTKHLRSQILLSTSEQPTAEEQALMITDADVVDE